MAPPVTEIAYITLKPHTDISGSSEAAKAWKEGLKTIAKQDGYQGSSYGRAIESSDLLMWFINWDSQDSHTKFSQSAAYESFKDSLSILMTAVHFHHVPFKPFPPTILTRAPVIEFATFLDTKSNFISHVDRFMDGIGTPEKCYGGAWGDSIETDVGKHSDGSVKGKATILLIGWESKEAHMKFRETDVFEENIGLLREGMGGVEMFHVPFISA